MSAPLTIRRSYIELHIAVLLWGFTAILGKWIQLPALDLVWWRVGITSLSLLVFVQWGRKVAALPPAMIATYMGIGVVVGLHWVTFYGSIKLANASVTLVCMATTSFFAALIEPLVLRRRVERIDLLLSILIIPAMVLVVQSLAGSMMLGVACGLLSAALAATFSVLNKKYIDRADAYTITFVELGSAFLFLTIVMGMADFGRVQHYALPPSSLDWLWLIVLSLVCTTLTFVLSLRALKALSAFASTLVVNLEPVYGIILAIFLLEEHKELSPYFYLGAAIILAIVLTYPAITRRWSKEGPRAVSN